MARNKHALHRFKPIRGYKSSQNPPRRRIGSKPPQRCKPKNRNRSLSPWRSGWRETIRNMSTWTEDKVKNSMESITSKEQKSPPSNPTNFVKAIPTKSSQRSNVSKTRSMSSNPIKSSGTVSNCTIKPQISKMESKPVHQLKQLERQVIICLFLSQILVNLFHIHVI